MPAFLTAAFSIQYLWSSYVIGQTIYIFILFLFQSLFTNKDISLIRRGRLYSSCVQSSMLHGSETWPVRKENEVALALQRAEMRMV